MLDFHNLSGTAFIPTDPRVGVLGRDKMPVKIIYFVHGTTVDNEKDLATGWNPGELSKKGIEQSKELGKMVANEKFDALFCSDLKRAVDSAEIAFGGKYKIIKDKRLREANYGDLTRTDFSKFKNNLKDFVDKPFPNGESYKDVEKRVSGFLEFLKENYSGKHIAIFAHQAPQLALDVLLNGKTWETAIKEDWRNKKEWKPGWIYLIK
jgi:broad specificity phosphatase PhoE